MISGILDSSVLIDCLRGHMGAVAFLAAQSATGNPVTHVIVAAELLAGARDKREQGVIESFLGAFTVLLPNESDALAARPFIIAVACRARCSPAAYRKSSFDLALE